MKNKDHLLFLDGFRGFAALWVVMSHCLILSGHTLPVLSKGGIAVDIFMIMSGFLMVFHYFKREALEPWEQSSTWLKFYVRRFFRIAPLYYLLFFIVMLLGHFLGDCRQAIAGVFPASHTSVERYTDHSFLNIFTHLTFIFGLLPNFAFTTPLPDWSIGLEMQFYLVFPFLMLFLRKNNYIWPIILIAVLCFMVSKFFIKKAFPMPSFLPLKIHLFFIGMLLASAYSYKSLKDDFKFKTHSLFVLIFSGFMNERIILFVSFVILGILFYDEKSYKVGLFRIFDSLKAVLGSKFSTFMADVSYSVYLLHLLIMLPWGAWLIRHEFYLKAPGTKRFLMLFILTVLPTYLISWFLYRFIELPGIAYGKVLVSKLSVKN